MPVSRPRRLGLRASEPSQWAAAAGRTATSVPRTEAERGGGAAAATCTCAAAGRGAQAPEAELAESAARLRLEPTFDRREQRQRWRQPGIGHELAELRQVARAAGHGLTRVLGEVPPHPSLPGVHERLIDARQRRA